MLGRDSPPVSAATADVSVLLGSRGLYAGGETAAVADHKRKELAGVPIARHVTPGIGKAAEQPTEVHAVGPVGDLHLVSTQERNCCSNAVNRGFAVECIAQIQAETLLGSSTKSHHDVARTSLTDTTQQFFVLYCVSIDRRDVAIFFTELNSLAAQPGAVAAGGFFPGPG